MRPRRPVTSAFGLSGPSNCAARSGEHTSELQSHSDLVCRLLLEKKKTMHMPARRTLATLIFHQLLLHVGKHFIQAASLFVFFFNDTATTEIYTLSLHDALPISQDKTFELKLSHWVPPSDPLQKRSEEHTSELQSHSDLVCRLLLETKKKHSWCLIAPTSTREKAIEVASLPVI